MPLRHLARFAGALTILSALGSFVPARMVAQGSDVDIIVGTIRDKSGSPVAGAKIEATSIETDVTRTTTTKANGTYLMQFYQGGGQYRITVSAIGHTPYIANVTRQSDDDRIDFDVTLGEQAIKLQDVVATGDRRPNLDQLNQPGVAASEHNISGEQAMHLPIDASDLSMLAALAPGVIFTAGTDSTNSTFSVAGQSAASNSYVVDGVTTTSTSIPQDDVRNTRVITNTYDVSRGGFAGGQVSVQTKGGSNRVSGSLSSRLQDRNLAWGADQSSVFNAGQTQQQIGAGFGGPLQRNKTFLFGSFQFNRSLNPIASLDLADPATLTRLGAAPDSVSKFISLVNATGLTQRAGVIDPNRTMDRFNGSLRFDWNMGQVNIVTMSANVGVNSQEPQNIGSTQLPQVGGNSTGHNAGLNFMLASRFGRWVNQFRTGLSYTTSSSDPYLYTPSGRVTVQSTLDSSQIAVSNLSFGGNAGLPRSSTNRSAQAIDELSFLPGAATHRFLFGIDASALDFNTSTASNQNGTYTYATLADFANNIPSSFTRTLQPSDRTGTQYNEAIYLSDAWRPRSSSSRGGTTGGGGGGGFGGGGGGFRWARRRAGRVRPLRRRRQHPVPVRHPRRPHLVQRCAGAQPGGVRRVRCPHRPPAERDLHLAPDRIFVLGRIGGAERPEPARFRTAGVDVPGRPRDIPRHHAVDPARYGRGPVGPGRRPDPDQLRRRGGSGSGLERVRRRPIDHSDGMPRTTSRPRSSPARRR